MYSCSSMYSCSVVGRSCHISVMADGDTVVRAYRYALDLTDAQEASLRSHCGAQRFAYNWALGAIKANWAQRAAERTYGVPEADLTPRIDTSAYGLRRRFNELKDEIAPWWRENSKEAYSAGIANVAAALRTWDRRREGRRTRSHIGFPRFKSRRSSLACSFSTGSIGLVTDDSRHVKLPRVGSLRTHESTRKLGRRVAAGTARIRSATVSYARGRWFVSFSVEISRPTAARSGEHGIIGIDLGLSNLAVLSTPLVGVSDERGMIANAQRYERAQKKLRVLNRQAARRQGPDPRLNVTPSSRWERTHKRVARLQASVANGRQNDLHQLSSRLVKRANVIVIEDLYVAGMLRNHSLARRIAGAGWGELRRQLTYKARWNGCEIVVADRFFGSSRICSGCGSAKAKLTLSERVFCCDTCGQELDRDVNAARNLAALVARDTSSSSCGATLNEPAGNPRQTGALPAADTATGSPKRTTSRSDARLPSRSRPRVATVRFPQAGSGS